MKKLILILLIGILLIGCSTYKELLPEQEPQIIREEVIKEVIKEKIIYRNTTIPCNITPECPEYNYTSSTNRELELIRRIKFLEGQQDKFINHSDCFDDLNKTKIKLEDCEEELCYEWNSSWC